MLLYNYNTEILHRRSFSALEIRRDIHSRFMPQELQRPKL